jgi:hypothetical protein
MNTRKFSLIKWRRRSLAVAAIALCTPLLAAQSDRLSMLRGLEKGEWTVKYRDGTAPTKICLKTGEEIIQIRHLQARCDRFVVDDRPRRVDVQYACPGNGYARTSIRKENASLVQVKSYGIASGEPFELVAEARRTGEC